MASEASHITHEVFGEIRAGGSSLARPRADLLVYSDLSLFFLDELELLFGIRALFGKRTAPLQTL